MMWCAILLVSIYGLVQELSATDPTVSTKLGVITGVQSDDGTYNEFLGIPYGVVNKPNLFGPSVAHPGFNETFQANASTICLQSSDNVTIGIIDCLTLNIYVPVTTSANSSNSLPVMIWIHGGAFVTGSSTPDYGPKFMLQHDVIIVAINYRLGVYGFMCLDIPEVSGNQGLKDQELALRWVSDNIGAFGGDADKITLWGESAGGMSVNLHLLSLYASTYKQAIIESGPAVSPWVMADVNNMIPLELAEALGYVTENVTDAVAYLSSVDPHELVETAFELKITSSVGTDSPLVLPCIEKELEGVEHFMTEHPMNIKSDKVATTPVIIGNNNNELAFQYGNAAATFFSEYNFGLFNLSFNLRDIEDSVADVRHFYIGDDETSVSVRDQLTDFATDFIFMHPTQRMVQRFLEIGATTVYRYIFSYAGGRNMLKRELDLNVTGAIHADELGYLFDIADFRGNITTADQLMIDRMTTLWSNFVKYGNPTPETTELLPFQWETSKNTTLPYLSIGSDLIVGSRPYHQRLAFWDQFYKLHKTEQKWYEPNQ